MNAPDTALLTAQRASQLRGTDVKQVTISGLTTTIQIGDGFDQVLTQTGAVTGDCWIVNGKVTRVQAPDGIEFANEGVSIKLAYDADITGMCDLVKVAADIVADQEEREELALHVHGGW